MLLTVSAYRRLNRTFNSNRHTCKNILAIDAIRKYLFPHFMLNTAIFLAAVGLRYIKHMAFLHRIIFIVINDSVLALFDSAVILIVPIVERFTDCNSRFRRIYLNCIPKRKMRIIDCKFVKS